MTPRGCDPRPQRRGRTPPQVEGQRVVVVARWPPGQLGVEGVDVDRPRGVAHRLEPAGPPRLGLLRVDRRVVVRATARVDDVVGGTAEREPACPIDHVERQRRVDLQRRVQRRPRLPGLVADAGHVAARRAGGRSGTGRPLQVSSVPARGRSR